MGNSQYIFPATKSLFPPQKMAVAPIQPKLPSAASTFTSVCFRLQKTQMQPPKTQREKKERTLMQKFQQNNMTPRFVPQ